MTTNNISNIFIPEYTGIFNIQHSLFCPTAMANTAPKHKSPSSSAHPTAKALFAAFSETSKNQQQPQQSAFIRKQSITLGWRSRHSQDAFYPITINGVELSIQQFQRGEIEDTYGTGATVWPASVVLCKYMELHQHSVIQNKTILDLGAGTGITSLAAAILGAASVTCTDGCEKVVELAQANVDRIFTTTTETPIHVCHYGWGDRSIQSTFNVILVADCVLPKLYPIAPLVAAIDELLDVDGVALLSYEHRYYPDYDPRTHFVDLAYERNLVVETILQDEHDPVYSVDDIEIWKVRRVST